MSAKATKTKKASAKTPKTETTSKGFEVIDITDFQTIASDSMENMLKAIHDEGKFKFIFKNAEYELDGMQAQRSTAQGKAIKNYLGHVVTHASDSVPSDKIEAMAGYVGQYEKIMKDATAHHVERMQALDKDLTEQEAIKKIPTWSTGTGKQTTYEGFKVGKAKREFYCLSPLIGKTKGETIADLGKYNQANASTSQVFDKFIDYGIEARVDQLLSASLHDEPFNGGLSINSEGRKMPFFMLRIIKPTGSSSVQDTALDDFDFDGMDDLIS